MSPQLRTAGLPSAIEAGTHDDADLRPAIPFEGTLAATEPADFPAWDELDEIAISPPPPWLVSATRMIRPICVGALMAIPTLGAATVGTVALFSGEAADRAVRASTAFLAGIPTEIVVLIGTLATGYSLSKTVERLRGARR